MGRFGWVAFVVSYLAAGCGASVKAEARASLDADDVERAPPAEASVEESDVEAAAALVDPAASAPVALLGARPDLTLAESADAKPCKCVRVALGAPNEAAFRWKEGPPTTHPETQLAIALAPTPCEGQPEGSTGPSYWGYRIVGGDVVVLLEPWREQEGGPPRVLGALIPKPPEGGQVYVAPAESGLPYGQSAKGDAARCALGNPGPSRARPFTEHELGQQ
ncbi:MAG TPA: hypothetical protein VKY73_21705 [Polyangiaceae bacterium]|nr:hypothetical protein [Polyangiaceae bacterium]